MSASDLLLVIIAVILPPVAVALKRGCGADLIINILLTILGHIPGVIHAVYIVLRDRERSRNVAYTNHNQSPYVVQPPPQPQVQPIYRDQPQPMYPEHDQPRFEENMPPTYLDEHRPSEKIPYDNKHQTV